MFVKVMTPARNGRVVTASLTAAEVERFLNEDQATRDKFASIVAEQLLNSQEPESDSHPYSRHPPREDKAW